MPPKLILGENGCAAYDCTTSKCLDLFSRTSPGGLYERLEAAWDEDPLLCVKIIFNMGNVRRGGGGKQDRTNFYRSMVGLWRVSPQTVVANVGLIPRHTSLKCLLDILMFIVHDEAGGGTYYSLEQTLVRAQYQTRRREARSSQGRNTHRRLAVWSEFAASLTPATRAELLSGGPAPRVYPASAKGAAAPGDGAPGTGLFAAFTVSELLQKMPAVSTVGGVGVEDAAAVLRRLVPERARCGAVTLECTAASAPTLQSVRDVLVCAAACRTGDDALLAEWDDRRMVAEVRQLVCGTPPPRVGCTGGGRDEDVFWAGEGEVPAPRLRSRSADADAGAAPVVDAKAGVPYDASPSEEQALVAALARELGPAVAGLRVPRPLCAELRGLRAEKGFHRKLLDPRVHSMWANDAVAAAFAAFCRTRDAAYAERAKSAAAALAADAAGAVAWARAARAEGRRPELARLYEAVVSEFVQGLVVERARAAEGKVVGGMHAKWAPRWGGRHDKATGVCADLVAALLPALGLEAVGPTPPQHVYQRDVLAPLRRAAKIPESFVGRGEWGAVDYKRMPSRCWLLHGERTFRRRDPARYTAFLMDCMRASRPLPCGALLPHEVTERAAKSKARISLTLSLQWAGLVQGCRDAWGSGGGCCVPMCDVSGSMCGEPMVVAKALSLLLAEAAPVGCPFRGLILSFASNPTLHKVKGMPAGWTGKGPASAALALQQLGDLGRRVRALSDLPVGYSTNVSAAFDLLLQTAAESRLSAEFVSRMSVCVFSDMEFNQGVQGGSRWSTMHEQIKKKFAAKGYPEIPRVVYWNLRGSPSVPVADEDAEGVALLSGFSAGLLRSFLRGSLDAKRSAVTPMETMLRALSGRLYESLRV